MISILLWVLGCYALMAAAVHAAYAVSRRRSRKVKHYVLLAGNERHRMEWYIRSIRRFSRLRGEEVKVTVVDSRSDEETLGIARCFARGGMDVTVGDGDDVPANEEGKECRGQGEAGSAKVVVDLRNPDDLSKLPL